MIDRVQVHNRLNGYRFVAVEFGVIAAVTAAFAVAWIARGSWLLAAVAAGIFVNSAVIVGAAVRSIFRGERGVGIWKVYTDPGTRRAVVAEHPDLSSDTAMVAVAALIPFALAAVIAIEAAARTATRRP